MLSVIARPTQSAIRSVVAAAEHAYALRRLLLELDQPDAFIYLVLVPIVEFINIVFCEEAAADTLEVVCFFLQDVGVSLVEVLHVGVHSLVAEYRSILSDKILLSLSKHLSHLIVSFRQRCLFHRLFIRYFSHNVVSAIIVQVRTPEMQGHVLRYELKSTV